MICFKETISAISPSGASTGMSVWPWLSSNVCVKLIGGRLTHNASAFVSSSVSYFSAISLTVGSRPFESRNFSRNLVVLKDNSLTLRLTFTASPSRNSLYISPNITGTA